MRRDLIGRLLFWSVFTAVFLFYFLTSPRGYPWGDVTHWALAWSGVITPLDPPKHPVWGYFVQVFDGHYIAFACFSAASAIAFSAVIINRHFSWRPAVAFAVGAAALPAIWDSAVLGAIWLSELSVFLMAGWLVNAYILFVTRHSRRPPARGNTKREKAIRIAGLAAISVVGVAAFVSIAFHDYGIGESASEYARILSSEADGRWIVLDGLVDDQLAAQRVETIQLREDDAYRKSLLRRVRTEWPNESDLCSAAERGVAAFLSFAQLRHPDRFFRTDGSSTTADGWRRRCEFLKTCVSRDVITFASLLRRSLTNEGLALAGRLREEGREMDAWGVYWMIYFEVDARNADALRGLERLLDDGYEASASQRERIMKEIEAGNFNSQTKGGV